MHCNLDHFYAVHWVLPANIQVLEKPLVLAAGEQGPCLRGTDDLTWGPWGWSSWAWRGDRLIWEPRPSWAWVKMPYGDRSFVYVLTAECSSQALPIICSQIICDEWMDEGMNRPSGPWNWLSCFSIRWSCLDLALLLKVPLWLEIKAKPTPWVAAKPLTLPLVTSTVGMTSQRPHCLTW